MSTAIDQQVETFQHQFKRIRDEVSKVIVGHGEIIDGVIMCLLANGHVLLEGVPGPRQDDTGSTLGDVVHLKFSRIQFTPDLMPADIIGTNVIVENQRGGKSFEFQHGPDLRQHRPRRRNQPRHAKTQSALLEAMQEKQVTVGGRPASSSSRSSSWPRRTRSNMEGTYPLPEAQLDRFFFKLDGAVSRPRRACTRSSNRTTTGQKAEVDRVVDGPRDPEMRRTVRAGPDRPARPGLRHPLIARHAPARPRSPLPMVNQFVRYGASPRGAQAIMLGGKVRALLDRPLPRQLQGHPRRRLPRPAPPRLLNFEGEAEGIDTDSILKVDSWKGRPRPNVRM